MTTPSTSSTLVTPRVVTHLLEALREETAATRQEVPAQRGPQQAASEHLVHMYNAVAGAPAPRLAGHRLCCDRCGQQVKVPPPEGITASRQQLWQQGWSTVGVDDFCPECSEQQTQA